MVISSALISSLRYLGNNFTTYAKILPTFKSCRKIVAVVWCRQDIIPRKKIMKKAFVQLREVKINEKRFFYILSIIIIMISLKVLYFTALKFKRENKNISWGLFVNDVQHLKGSGVLDSLKTTKNKGS